MYPVDLLKVATVLFVNMELFELNIDSDADANHQPFRWRSLHRSIECSLYDIQNRGSTDVMERDFKCHCWCWWDIPLVHGPDTWADFPYRTCTCSILWHI